MIEEQGEEAFVIENDGEKWKITQYTVPRRGKVFEPGEIRNAFLAQSMTNTCFADID